MNDYYPFPEVKAVNVPAKKLIVFIHGLGSDGNDLISLAPLIQQQLPDYHFISPHGVEAYDMAPYGRQWFSLSDRNPYKILELVAKNVLLLGEIIKSAQNSLGLSNKDTAIIGFSQGCMIGLYLTLIQSEPFEHMIGFSGRLVPPPKCINKNTPVCLIHGVEDEVIEVKELDHMSRYLNIHSIKNDTLKIPNLGHTIDNQGLEFALQFIKNN
ncbi:MAG: hydrolase [Rickettsiaceae bacterium]|nr:MAG: hydrolase [Rickettsiaceae bacterium]